MVVSSHYPTAPFHTKQVFDVLFVDSTQFLCGCVFFTLLGPSLWSNFKKADSVMTVLVKLLLRIHLYFPGWSLRGVKESAITETGDATRTSLFESGKYNHFKRDPLIGFTKTQVCSPSGMFSCSKERGSMPPDFSRKESRITAISSSFRNCW